MNVFPENQERLTLQHQEKSFKIYRQDLWYSSMCYISIGKILSVTFFHYKIYSI